MSPLFPQQTGNTKLTAHSTGISNPSRTLTQLNNTPTTNHQLAFPFHPELWHNSTTPTMRPWSTIECSQPAAWTTNRSLLVASRVRPFQEDRSIPARPYPEQRTWMVVRSGVISAFPTHSENAPASPDICPTTWLCPACLPNTSSIPAPIQPTIAMTTTHIHQLWLTRPPSTCSSSASEDHPQAPVVTQQQQHQPSTGISYPSRTLTQQHQHPHYQPSRKVQYPFQYSPLLFHATPHHYVHHQLDSICTSHHNTIPIIIKYNIM